MIGKKEWPEFVPELTEDHFTCDVYKDDHGHRCLLGQARAVFAGANYERIDGDVVTDHEEGRIGGVFRIVVDELIAATGGKIATDVACFNDNNDPKTCAKLWNKTMAKFGYTEQA